MWWADDMEDSYLDLLDNTSKISFKKVSKKAKTMEQMLNQKRSEFAKNMRKQQNELKQEMDKISSRRGGSKHSQKSLRSGTSTQRRKKRAASAIRKKPNPPPSITSSKKRIQSGKPKAGKKQKFKDRLNKLKKNYKHVRGKKKQGSVRSKSTKRRVKSPDSVVSMDEHFDPNDFLEVAHL